MSNENTNFVWAVFDSKNAAETVAKSLKDWDKASKDIKLGAIGVVYLDDKGKLKTKKMGPRNTGSGALIGAILGGIVALFAPATLIGGAIAGTVAGGALGVFSKKGLGLSDAQKNEIKTNLDAGKGLLIVLANDQEVGPTEDYLEKMGGKTESAQADADAIDDTDAAMAEAGVQAEVETATG